MPQVKVKFISSFSSEDPVHRVQNLIKGNGKWLSSASDSSKILTADLQLEQAVIINYVDIGNSGSALLRIDVGRSATQAYGGFKTLLPTVVLMTPVDCRSNKNSSAVRMFGGDDMNSDVASEKWDIVRLCLQQPYFMKSQFGIAFLRIFSNEFHNNETSHSLDMKSDCLSTEMKCHRLISGMNLDNLPDKVLPKSLRNLESSCLVIGQNDGSDIGKINGLSLYSPISRAGKMLMAGKHKSNSMDSAKQLADFECSALEFVICLNLTYEQLNTLKVSSIRQLYEKDLGRPLTLEEKVTFKDIALDFASRSLLEFEKRLAAKHIDGKDSNGRQGSLVETVKSDEFSDAMEVVSAKLTPVDYKQESKRSSSGRTDPVVACQSQKKRKFRFHHLNKLCGSDFDDATHVRENSCGMSSRNALAFSDSRVLHSAVGKTSQNEEGNYDRQIKLETSTPTPKKLISTLTHASSESNDSRPKELNSVIVCLDIKDNDIELPDSSVKSDNGKSLSFVRCPVCSGMFSSHEIQSHASHCGITDEDARLVENFEECPVCGEFCSADQFEEHVTRCADSKFN